jgi:hypothetical protein
MRPSERERSPDEAGYHQHRHQAVQPVEAVSRVRWLVEEIGLDCRVVRSSIASASSGTDI